MRNYLLRNIKKTAFLLTKKRPYMYYFSLFCLWRPLLKIREVILYETLTTKMSNAFLALLSKGFHRNYSKKKHFIIYFVSSNSHAIGEGLSWNLKSWTFHEAITNWWVNFIFLVCTTGKKKCTVHTLLDSNKTIIKSDHTSSKNAFSSNSFIYASLIVQCF